MKLAILTLSCATLVVLLYLERQREKREASEVNGLMDQLRAVIASPVVDEAQRRRDALAPPVSRLRIRVIKHAVRKGAR